ncbi:hypothetical protein ACFC14_05145 [Microbacterium sp. NPDC055988]|uniref:hypothetical protein n=1 Tax=Microbacterium sp. NPDC055988 TaxID=3345671 RepID=UPI0035DBED14
MRRPYVAACIALLMALGFSACAPAPASPGSTTNDTAMTVNGTPVHADEFRHCVGQVRATVWDTASKKGWAVDDADPVRDSRAGELLVDRAAARCTDGVVRRQGAVALTLIDDASFESLVERWSADNAAREAAAQAGEVLYGPVEKTLEQYEFQEMADAASEQEKADAAALTDDPEALDAAIRARPDAAEGLDMADTADRTIAAQVVAREMFDSALAQAVSDAEVTMNESWLSGQSISDLAGS